jgi:hypothetical protein
MMKSYRVMGFVFVASLVCLVGMVQADTTNLVANGDFSAGLTGWANYGGAVAVSNTDGSPDGTSVSIAGAGWLVSPAVSSALVEGQTYKVSYLAALLAVNGATNPDDSILVCNTDGSQSNVAHESQLVLNEWKPYSYQYTATAADIGHAVHVNFLNSMNYWSGHSATSGAPCTFGIDSVSFTAVPEPSTLVLASMGLFGLLAYAWRKRK